MNRCFLAIAVIVYVLLATASVIGMNRARRNVMENASAATQADWETWRAAAREQADGSGPVSRRVPKSDQPPALVLLRDYYGMCLAAVLLFGSLSYLVLMFFLHGATAKPRSESSSGRDSTVPNP